MFESIQNKTEEITTKKLNLVVTDEKLENLLIILKIGKYGENIKQLSFPLARVTLQNNQTNDERSFSSYFYT